MNMIKEDIQISIYNGGRDSYALSTVNKKKEFCKGKAYQDI